MDGEGVAGDADGGVEFDSLCVLLLLCFGLFFVVVAIVCVCGCFCFAVNCVSVVVFLGWLYVYLLLFVIAVFCSCGCTSFTLRYNYGCIALLKRWTAKQPLFLAC